MDAERSLCTTNPRKGRRGMSWILFFTYASAAVFVIAVVSRFVKYRDLAHPPPMGALPGGPRERTGTLWRLLSRGARLVDQTPRVLAHRRAEGDDPGDPPAGRRSRAQQEALAIGPSRSTSASICWSGLIALLLFGAIASVAGVDVSADGSILRKNHLPLDLHRGLGRSCSWA